MVGPAARARWWREGTAPACTIHAVELDRQSIEKRDFPIGRRGYDPAAVDAHLRTIAAEVEELRYALESRGGETLGSSAGTQVQVILDAAEATAAEIEQRAADDAHATREQAAADAEHTRAEAIARARAHVAAVARATAVLAERIESMDAQSAALVAALRDGAARLGTDLSAVEANMGELYDAAAGRASESAGDPSFAASPAAFAEPAPAFPGLTAEEGTGLGGEAPVRQGHSEFVPAAAPAPKAAPEAPAPSAPPAAPAVPAAASPSPTLPFAEDPAPTAGEPSGANGDLDGARLIALNMALNGDSRAATDRFLAEHYDELADRQKLLDEVFAAVEG
jgi:DivIVA domain-containing protein